MYRFRFVLVLLIGSLFVLSNISHAQCSYIKGLTNGTLVTLTGKQITATGGSGGVPTDYAYIEDSDRVSGIKIHVSSLAAKGVGIGDQVTVYGAVATANDEKYIEVMNITKTVALVPLEAFGMTNNTAIQSNSQGLFIKTWGKVTSVGTNYFIITDGSATSITVSCGSVPKPTVGKIIRVRGIANGTTLLMRKENCDWAYAEQTYQALPFPGKYKYPREWLVLGPFKDSSLTYDYDLLYIDFIKAATGVDEYAAEPKAGDMVGSKTWTRVRSPFDVLALDSAFATTNVEHSAIYVHLYVWSDTDNPYIYIVSGSNDWLRVWVNGNDSTVSSPEVLSVTQYTCSYGRALTYGNDGPVAISLHKGLNSIMFKVVNKANLCALCCQFIPYSAVKVTGYGGYAPYTGTGLGYVISP